VTQSFVIFQVRGRRIDYLIGLDFKALYKYSMVMGIEAAATSENLADEPKGLCNAILISKPYSAFIGKVHPLCSRLQITIADEAILSDHSKMAG
jgi:hypothetical protein